MSVVAAAKAVLRRRPVRFVLLAFLVWRGTLFAVDFVSLNLFPYKPDPQIQFRWAFKPDANYFLNSFARWDTDFYKQIADHGYSNRGNLARVAFFPGFPYAARAVGAVAGDSWWGGLIVASLAFLFSLLFLYGIARRYLDDDGAERVVLGTLCFPMTFFYSCFYSEGLFFLTVTGAFYYYERDRFLPAALFGVVAAFTRSTGVLLLPALLLGAVHRAGWRPFGFKLRHLWLLLIPLGLLAFVAILANEPHIRDGFAWVKAQAHWARESKFPLATLWDEAKNLSDPWSREADPWGAGRVLSWAGVVIVWGAAVFAIRRLDLAHTLFALATLVLPLMSGRTLSMNRFALGVPAVFLAIGLVTNARPTLWRGWLFASSAFAALMMVGFATWRFVG